MSGQPPVPDGLEAGGASQATEETQGVFDENWFGASVLGQPSVSNWPVDELDVAYNDAEPILQLEQSANSEQDSIGQHNIDLGWGINFDLDKSTFDTVIPSIEPPYEQDVQQHPESILPEPLPQRELAHSINGGPVLSQDNPNHCTQCNKQLSGSKELRRHIQTVHEKQRTQCPQCQKWLMKRSDNLRRHMTRYCRN
ncbi:hypothetical protein F4806DRAFT_471169, partial [Annulohypoxylon nitens]